MPIARWLPPLIKSTGTVLITSDECHQRRNLSHHSLQSSLKNFMTILPIGVNAELQPKKRASEPIGGGSLKRYGTIDVKKNL
jgi:hypothetical protein